MTDFAKQKGPEQNRRLVDFRTSPDAYKHWWLEFEAPIARLILKVDAGESFAEGYELKLNSYDIGVDIELYDAVQRLRFEHPEIKVVVLQSAEASMFCAGANIRMLAGASHGHKVNFCKFTNETRNAIEDASAHSGQRYLAALAGTAAGGGYELALATDHILLIDDGNSAVSLPEVPLLAVLPGTGGLTRVVDKRKVRRDLADVFCTVEEGIKGQRAVDWRLVDEIAPSSKFDDAVNARATAMTAGSDRPDDANGISLGSLQREDQADEITYPFLKIVIDRNIRCATLTLQGPDRQAPESLAACKAEGDDFWPLALTRALDDAILHLRFNEPDVGTWIFRSEGGIDDILSYDRILRDHENDWFVREVLLYLKRSLKRLDVSARTLLTLVMQGSCFAGFLAELLFAADRSYMLEGQFEDDDRPPPEIVLTESNFGALPMPNDLSRLATRFVGADTALAAARNLVEQPLLADQAVEAGLVTAALDDIDWDDEIRVLLEERASFSPDALSGMEANLRFPGPETLETKIFGRLSAWQNWVFQRPNAVGAEGALRSYGTGRRPEFDHKRV